MFLENEYNNHIIKWKKYIRDNILPIIKRLNVKLEGNIYSSHLTFEENNEMKDKQNNFYRLLKKINAKNVLEIGFNSGFSCLFMKMMEPTLDITCVDINLHKYVVPCFEKLKKDFDYLKLLPYSSYDVVLPELIKDKKTYDLIHIDGDHRIEGAKKDLDLCLKLCHENTIIIFDDTNLKYLDDLCNSYIEKGLLINYELNGFKNEQKYKHRLLKVVKNEKLPIYVSVTSIFKNQDILLFSLKSILNQSLIPDKIFIFLSTEEYLLDDGFKNKIITYEPLLAFIENNKDLIELKWTKNIGSYRKLLPLLKDKWNDNCIIITIDDDTEYHKDLINNLVTDYYSKKCVIGYRGFTPKMDKLQNFNYENKDKLKNKDLYNFLTGKGGILYKPEFFHKTLELIFSEEIFLTLCDKQDDIWFYLIRIKNNIDCFIDNKEWISKDLHRGGLCDINNKDNLNNKVFKKTLDFLYQI